MSVREWLLIAGVLLVLIGLAGVIHARRAGPSRGLPPGVAREVFRDIIQTVLESQVMGTQVFLGKELPIFAPPAPREERRTWQETVMEAELLAREGKIDDGYRRLLAGRRRALEFRDDRKPWGQGLARFYQIALDRYTARYVTGEPRSSAEKE